VSWHAWGWVIFGAVVLVVGVWCAYVIWATPPGDDGDD
jgi:hypothetical protein